MMAQLTDQIINFHILWPSIYNPVTGRFMSGDKIKVNMIENHPYRYALNSPINYTDSNGLLVDEIKRALQQECISIVQEKDRQEKMEIEALRRKKKQKLKELRILLSKKSTPNICQQEEDRLDQQFFQKDNEIQMIDFEIGVAHASNSVTIALGAACFR